MTTHELIEMAVLDALGILETDELIAFEQAFAGATPEVQAQVRDEQDRMLDIRHLLPDETPRAELRELVLAAVRAASGREPTPVAGRITPSVQPVQPKISSAQRVHHFWRTAALGLGAAAAVAFGVFVVQTQQYINQAQQRKLVISLYDGVGPQVVEDMLFDARTSSVAFSPTENAHYQAAAAVWQNPEWDNARLFVKNLKTNKGEQFRLVVLDENGQIVREVAEFEGTGQLEDIRVSVNLSTEKKLAIMRSPADDPDLNEIVLIAGGQV